MTDSPLSGDSAYFLDLLARYRRDKLAVPADWRLYFESLDGPPDGTRPADGLADALIDGYRVHGHVEATLDPLGLNAPMIAPPLQRLRDRAASHAGVMTTATIGGVNATQSLTELEARLRRLYAGPVALECSHLSDEAERDWLYSQFEKRFSAPPDAAMLARALTAVSRVDEFENFLHIKFPAKKRFGAEGAETSVMLVRELLVHAAGSGIDAVYMGGMHRGRLALLATVLEKPLVQILAEIKDRDGGEAGPAFVGDVPYHLGYTNELSIGGTSINVNLAPHPSHLITVAPVALGRCRAERDRTGQDALCLLLHTDAAFSGQGLVSEIMQLGGLAAYGVGGAIHLVVNNQIGFTTLPSEGRSARYCTDIGKAVGIPVLHVNGDNADAVARVAALAMEWRMRHGKDILIDLVCYRRNGHNELDEFRFTQPLYAAAMQSLPSVRALFLRQLAGIDPLLGDRDAALTASLRAEMEAAYQAVEGFRPNDGHTRKNAWRGITPVVEAGLLAPVTTGLPLDRLRDIGRQSCDIPATIAAHPKVLDFYRRRRESIEQGEDINLATAEALAFGSLLKEGVSVRLSGQDVERGTFTQRHLAVHDSTTGIKFTPMATLGTATGARFTAINSPLAEYAPLGFEYGYSNVDPGQLVVWEAQFGDFLNGAQIMVDQYIVSAESKWNLMSGLVVQLPHGLEGGGPDHSSARIERLLQLGASGNIVIANPTSPANLFHLLRRQIKAPWRKPLFLMTAKSMLRMRACVSTLAEFGPGTGFKAVLADEPPVRQAAPVTHVVLCSGKLSYDLAEARHAAGKDEQVTLIRLEQLYPFPEAELREALSAHAGRRLVWAQEEPENQGAWHHVNQEMVKCGLIRNSSELSLAARPAMPVPGGGSPSRHEQEEAMLLAQALAPSMIPPGKRTKRMFERINGVV